MTGVGKRILVRVRYRLDRLQMTDYFCLAPPSLGRRPIGLMTDYR